MLNWTRAKVIGNNGQGSHTTNTTNLPNGKSVMIKSVEGTFFFYIDGNSTGGFTDTLKDAKSRIQRVADQMEAR